VSDKHQKFITQFYQFQLFVQLILLFENDKQSITM
jgi:hypothetical protein